MNTNNVTVGTFTTCYLSYGTTYRDQDYTVEVNKLGNIEVFYSDGISRHTYNPAEIDILIDYLAAARDMSPAVVAAHKAAEEATKLAEQAKQAVLEKIARGGTP
jgi:hypothetical protein